MLEDCIICNKNYVAGDFAPENWFLCNDCFEKGYMVCEIDKKIFLKNERNIAKFHIDDEKILEIGNYNLLEDVTKEFKYIRYKTKVCSNKCFNILYINKCIEKLETLLSMIITEDEEYTYKFPISSKFKADREKFKETIRKKITELKRLKIL